MPMFIPLSGLRLFLGLPIAAAITVGLFLLMSGVLSFNDTPIGEPREPLPDFTANMNRLTK